MTAIAKTYKTCSKILLLPIQQRSLLLLVLLEELLVQPQGVTIQWTRIWAVNENQVFQQVLDLLGAQIY